MDERFAERLEEGLEVGSVDGAERTETEGVGRADLTWIDGETMFIAIVVDTFEIPVGIVGIKHTHHKS